MLEGLFVTPALTAVTEALRSASADAGKLAVVGHAKLATALAGSDRDVVPVGLSARAAKKHPNAIDNLSNIDERSLAAVIGVDIATSDDWETRLREWSR